MLFSETNFEEVTPIQAYGENFFRICHKKVSGGIFVFSHIIRSWHGFKDFSFLEEDLSSMEMLFIGTGKNHNHIDKRFNSVLIDSGVILEVFSTPVACRAYNVTISGHRKVGALLAPILGN